jgi:hypothetical protein
MSIYIYTVFLKKNIATASIILSTAGIAWIQQYTRPEMN